MTGPAPKPAAELEITESLVRSLLEAERPDLAAGALVPVEEGWDNAVWRLGEEHSVRVPRRAVAVPLLESEQRWLPVLTGRLSLRVPVPVHAGRPTSDYPWPWSICEWVPGRTVLQEPLVDQRSAGGDVARFLIGLHVQAPPGVPPSPFRGIPLWERDPVVRERASAIAHLVDVDALLALWQDALAAPFATGSRVWIHGDLHPRNVLALDGRLSGVIDFGDLGPGDPAVDLSSAWTLLDAPGERALRRAYPADDATWRRARGWAVNHGIACVATSADDATMRAIGHATLRRLLDDPR